MLCFEHVYVTTRCAVFSSPSALSHRRLAEMYRDSNDGASPACADHARDERTQACQHARVRSSPRVRMYALSDSLKRQEFHDTHVLVDHGNLLFQQSDLRGVCTAHLATRSHANINTNLAAAVNQRVWTGFTISGESASTGAQLVQ